MDTRLILSFYAFLFYLRKDQARTYHITYDQRQSSTCVIAIAATRASGGTGVVFATRLDSCQPWEIVDTQALCHMKNSEDWIRNSNFHSTLPKKGNPMHISKILTVPSLYLQNCWSSFLVHLTPLTSSNYFLLFPLFSKDTFKPRPQPPQHGSCDDQKPDQRRCFSGKPRSGRQLPRVRVALHGKPTAFKSNCRDKAFCIVSSLRLMVSHGGNRKCAQMIDKLIFLSFFLQYVVCTGTVNVRSLAKPKLRHVSDQCLDALNLWNLGSHRYISIQQKKQTYTFSKTFAKFRPGHLKKDLLSLSFFNTRSTYYNI